MTMKKTTKTNNNGFSLTELLIVVSLLALISIISISHYEKASTTSKLAETRELFRFISQGLESFKTENGIYPYDGYTAGGPGLPDHYYWNLGPSLTTPIAYLPRVDYDDPFLKIKNVEHDGIIAPYGKIRYTCTDSTWHIIYGQYTGRTTISIYRDDIFDGMGGWRLLSGGPDQTMGPNGWDMGTNYPESAIPIPYDPTNGLVSNGDVIRSQKYINGYYNVK
jgi:prepilin-type N-terminal cleavage/methylation domain-containing protein